MSYFVLKMRHLRSVSPTDDPRQPGNGGIVFTYSYTYNAPIDMLTYERALRRCLRSREVSGCLQAQGGKCITLEPLVQFTCIVARSRAIVSGNMGQ